MKPCVPLALFSVLALAAACGDDDGGGVDPRCESLCAVVEPELAGAYDVCSTASADLCARDCSARVAGAASLCATCLLEDACFAPDGCESSGPSTSCNSDGSCTVTGREGSCTYPVGDTVARDACLRQVFPRRTVECSVEYRPVSECGASCGAPDAGT